MQRAGKAGTRECLNTEDSVLRRLAQGPLTQAEIRSGYTNKILVRLQRRGLVTNYYACRGDKTTMSFKLEEIK